MGFEFSATAQCDYCGNYMDDSESECQEHSAEDVSRHFFRHLSTDELYAVRATNGHKWYKLFDVKGEDWIAWMYIGNRKYVQSMLSTNRNNSLVDINPVEMSSDAPDDVGVDE